VQEEIVESVESVHPGNANLLIGGLQAASQETGGPKVPREPRGWHSRGYLPHYDGDVATQHVAFHLADSLPTEVVQRLEEEVKTVPVERQDVERRRRVEAWIDSGHGSCVLRESSVGRMVEDSLLFFDAERYHLLAWVVMPNHVHVLFQPMNGWSVSTIVASWKKFMARMICEHWRASGANREIGAPSPVWHREYWDRYMRDEHHFRQTLEYVHQNPVRAGLVAKPEDWPSGSARLGGPGGSQRTANREIGVPGSTS
jgi:REP element-mobilizing transposase RayT